VIQLEKRQRSKQSGGEYMHMDEKSRNYILHRFKTMSYFSNCVPYEYPPHMIKSDMEKASMEHMAEEEQIEELLYTVKAESKEKILQMLKESRKLSEIRDWSEYSLDCPVPIPSVNSVNMNQLLSRYDYFNYELNRIVREEQISIAMRERREQGVMFDTVKLSREFERQGLVDSSDEFTKLQVMGEGELLEAIDEAEENSRAIILDYILEDAEKDEIIKKVSENSNMVFSKDEIPQVIDNLTRKERFSTITREVARMGTSEMWTLINNIEAFKMWRMSDRSKEPGMGQIMENQMLEMLKIYEQSGDSLKEGYLFQVSKLNNSDLAQLVRLIQGFISWKGAFYYLPPNLILSNEKELSKLMIEGFSHEHGMDPEIFRMFLIRR